MSKTKQLFVEQALPQLDAAFSSMDEHRYIAKLEIDLGKTTAENFMNDFQKALRDKLQLLPALSIDSTIQLNKDRNFTIDHFLFFLGQGYWPWNLQHKTGYELALAIQKFLTTVSAAMRLFEKLSSQPGILAERFILLLSNQNSTRKLLLPLLQRYHPALEAVVQLLPVSWQKKAFTPGTFYFGFLRELIVHPALATVEQICSLVEDMLSNTYSNPLQLAIISSRRLQATNECITAIQSLESMFALLEQRPFKNTTVQTIFSRESSSVVTGNLQQPDLNPEDKITISNAGLVLFHPYLPHVFRDLKWLKADNSFISRKSQQRAVLFLQYLVNGRSRQAEHLLVLNKILCNWPVHLPLALSCNFSHKEKTAAKDLLQSFREHWTVMKNTSDRGMMESFVVRQGLVQKKELGFLLQVERKTIDILMDSLPFGINIIKLPWNEHLIYTEW